jgi:hypothetical protein
MTTRSWIRNLFESRSRRTVRKAPARRWLSLETLEERAVPTVSFAPAVNYGTGSGAPVTVMTLKNPGQGIFLVTSNPGTDSLTLLQPNGGGTFETGRIFPLTNHFTGFSYSSNSIAIGDFDGDGYPDIATLDTPEQSVGVFLAAPIDGQEFDNLASITEEQGTNPTYVVAGNFNGDKNLDLAVASQATGTVSVLLGEGNGLFSAPITIANLGANSSISALAVGDFNGDGKLDVVTANAGTRSVSVLLGNGNGTFQSAVTYAVGSSPSSLAVADFNGDGKLDIAVTNAGSNSVSVLMGNGNGKFQSAVSYAVGVDPTSVAVGDFNNDGHPDLVVANTGSNSVSELTGNGNGTFQSAVNFAVGSLPTSVAVGDFNGDGKADIAVANSDSNAGSVSVLLNTTVLNIESAQSSVTTNEGTKVTNTGTFDDPAGPASVTLKASLGTVTKNAEDTGWNWSYTPTVGLTAPKTVTITATDASGATATTSFSLTVNFVAPTITKFSVRTTATEGSSVQLSGAATEPAGTKDPDTYTWTIYNPNGTLSTLTGANASFTPPDNGSYGVDLTVTDSGGLSTSEDLRTSLTNLYRGEGNANNTIGTKNGTVVGGVTYVTGKVGEAFNFNGTTGVVDLPNNLLPLPTSGTSTTPFSFDSWFKTSTGGVILGQAGLGTAGGYVPMVYVGTDGKLYAELGWDGSGNPVVSAGKVNNGQWHNVAVTYNGTSETVYLDGAAIKTVAFTETAYNSSGYAYTLGSGMASSTDGWPAAPSPSHGLYHFKGQIDEAGFYNTALSAANVQTIYNVGNFTSINVTNVPPTPALTGFTSVLANQQLTYKLSATDPSPVDMAAGFTYKIAWGDGSAAQTISPTANNGSGVSLAHDFTTAGTFTVSLTATDKDGGATTITEKVTVLPVTSANLQTVITQQGSISFEETTHALAQTLVSAINGLAAQTKPVTITINLGIGVINDLKPNPKGNITVVILGGGVPPPPISGVELAAGNALVENMTLATDTDSWTGGASQKNLAAGNTAFGTNQSALDALMADWTSSRDNAADSANRSGSGESNMPNGGSGSDSFFVELAQDILRGGQNGAIVESL